MNLQKKLWLFLFVWLLGACQAPAGEERTGEDLLTVNDSRGEVEIPFNPQNVVVFDFGYLDTLKALGLEEQIIGTVTNNPPAYLADFVSQYENVGTLKEPDTEKLAELQPELIVISNRMADFASELEKIAPVLLLTSDYEHYWDTAQQNIFTLAEVFGKTEEAEAAVAELQDKITNVKAAFPEEEKALALMLNDGSLSAFSNGSRFSFLFDTLGFTPVDAAIETSTHGQSIGYEGILEINPDILFVVDRSKAIQQGTESGNDLLNNEFIRKTNAYQKEQLVQLESDLWYLSGGGLESIELMVEEVQAYFE